MALVEMATDIQIVKKEAVSCGTFRKEGATVIFALRRVILLRSYIWAMPKLYSLREFLGRI